jgi:serine/threonine protein phosphatase PrpC
MVYKTDKGKLMPINEDMVGRVTISLGNDIEQNVADIIFVADGMGGHNRGDVASRIATQTLVFLVTNAVSRYSSSLVNDIEKDIPRYISNINQHIRKKAAETENLEGMGTTLTAGIIIKDKLIIIHVGDSRMYRIEKNLFQQISRDHSFVQELLDKGEITQEQAFNHPKKNKINRALGPKPSVVADVYVLDWTSGLLMLCTDGLTDMLTNKEIQDIVEANKKPQELCDKLVEEALRKGGHDNVSVLVAGR